MKSGKNFLQNYVYWKNLNFDLKEKFNPKVYHLTDGDYESELDSHLHYGDGSFPLKDLLGFVPDDAMVTNEAKREKFDEVVTDSNRFRSL